MNMILCADYMSSGEDALRDVHGEYADGYLIVQTLCNAGTVRIADRTYAMAYGGLGFIDGAASYRISPDEPDDYLHSLTVISRPVFHEMAALLECTGTISEVFSGGGLYFPLDHPKTVEARFKRMHSQFTATSDISNAMLFCETLPLLNYALYARAH